MKKNKILIIRFSSFGDIIQCSSVVEPIRRVMRQNQDQCEIHWATRSEFEYLVALNPNVEKIWSLDKKLGFIGLIKYALNLRNENFTHVYDAHNNLRSYLIKLFLKFQLNSPNLLIRSKDRLKRFFLFKFRLNFFPKPFKGIDSYINPLKDWGVVLTTIWPSMVWKFPITTVIKVEELMQATIKSDDFITLVPSAAWEMKRWPLDHWKRLIELIPDKKFIVLGGKEDFFCEEIMAVDSNRVFNFAGKLSLVESSYLIEKSHLVISADTGLLHVADVLGKKALSLMGPTAFGFTTNPKIKTLEVNLSCRPCSKDGRGKCSQLIYQQCMKEITPAMVASEVQIAFHE